MKVVINNCYGGFSLSPSALLELWKRGGPVEVTRNDEYWGKERDPDSSLGLNAQLKRWRAYLSDPERTVRESLFVTVFTPDETAVLSLRDGSRGESVRNDPLLVQLVEEWGDKAAGPCASLKIVEVPDDAEWEIAEYDGSEHVAEKHRTWP